MAWKFWLSPTAAVLTMLAGFCVSEPAEAVTLQCVPRESIFRSLKETNNEEAAHVGLPSTAELFEVLGSPNGSWMAFFTIPDEMTCPVATGESWRIVPAGEDDLAT